MTVQSRNTVKFLRMALISLITVSFVALYFFGVRQVGFSMESYGGKSTVTGGSHPVMLVWAGLAVVMFVVLMRVKQNVVIVGAATMRRRAAAFMIDFWFSVLALSSAGGLLPLGLEARRTGHFAWHFERDYTVGTDELGLLLVLMTMGLMLLYFVFPLTRGKQTVGCFVMRIKVTPPFGDEGCFTFKEALRRTWYEFRGLCWLWGPKGGRDSQGRTWYDRETNCSVVLVNYE